MYYEKYYYYYYVTLTDFVISALADGLSLGFEWQQVSSSVQDSSQYSGRSIIIIIIIIIIPCEFFIPVLAYDISLEFE